MQPQGGVESTARPEGGKDALHEASGGNEDGCSQMSRGEEDQEAE